MTKPAEHRPRIPTTRPMRCWVKSTTQFQTVKPLRAALALKLRCKTLMREEKSLGLTVDAPPPSAPSDRSMMQIAMPAASCEKGQRCWHQYSK